MFELYLETRCLFWKQHQTDPNQSIINFSQHFFCHMFITTKKTTPTSKSLQGSSKAFVFVFNQLFNSSPFLGCFSTTTHMDSSVHLQYPTERGNRVDGSARLQGLGTFDLCDTSGWIGIGWIANLKENSYISWWVFGWSLNLKPVLIPEESWKSICWEIFVTKNVWHVVFPGQ